MNREGSFKWKYGADITKTDINVLIVLNQSNAELMSFMYMIRELIDTYADFKVILNLCML